MTNETRESDQQNAAEQVELLSVGFDALYVTGQLGRARELFELAAARADEDDDSDSLALAAIGLSGLWVGESRSAVQQAQTKAWRQLALRRVDAGSPLWLRVNIREVGENDYARGRADNALAMVKRAESSGDVVAHAEALSVAHHCMLGPEHRGARLAIADELLALGAFTARPIDTHMGLLWRTVDLYLAGDPHADRSLAELRHRLDDHGHAGLAFVVAAIEVMREIRRADFDRAEDLAMKCAVAGQEAGDDDGAAWLGAHISVIRWYQGRSDELVGLFESLMPSPTLAFANEAFVAGLAVAAAAAGDEARAGAALNRLRGEGLSRLQSSSTWLVQLFGAIEAARLLQDTEAAAEAYELLKPYADLPVMASLAVACFGSAHYPLGVAARVIGDLDGSVEHLRMAVRANDAIGNVPARILAHLALAESLESRGNDGDGAAARLERSTLEGELQHRGMQRWLLARRPSAHARLVHCVQAGSEWHLSAFGRTVDVKDSVGMRYLAVLFANPAVEISAIDLVGDRVPGRATADPRQPVIDRAARLAFRDRLAKIRKEEDDALLRGDAARADRLRSEYDWIVDELRRSQGLGGREREFVGDAERARIAVQKAIRRALDAIQVRDAELARGLIKAVTTGTQCCYRPS